MLTRTAVVRPAAHTRRRRSSLLALGVVVTALGATGCGGSDSKKDDTAAFKKAASSAAAKTSVLGQDLGTAIQGASSKTDAALTAQFADLTTRARGIVAELKALKPTDEAKPKVDALASALDVGATDLDTITKAAGASDATAAEAATKKLVGDSPAISDANDALKSAVAAGS